MTKQKVEPGCVTLYPQDWAAVDSFAKDTGLNRSAAMRVIIRKWLNGEREKRIHADYEAIFPELTRAE